MTTDDFFLLFAAFGGFVIVPALLLWGFARLAHRKQNGRPGAGIRPDVDSTDASSGDGRREAARSGKANEFFRLLNTGKARWSRGRAMSLFHKPAPLWSLCARSQ